MTDKSITNKQLLIQQLREVAEKETTWLEKNRLLYTEKRSKLKGLIKVRGLSVGEVTSGEQSFSKHVAFYESRRSRMRGLAEEINREEKNLEVMKADQR